MNPFWWPNNMQVILLRKIRILGSNFGKNRFRGQPLGVDLTPYFCNSDRKNKWLLNVLWFTTTYHKKSKIGGRHMGTFPCKLRWFRLLRLPTLLCRNVNYPGWKMKWGVETALAGFSFVPNGTCLGNLVRL